MKLRRLLLVPIAAAAVALTPVASFALIGLDGSATDPAGDAPSAVDIVSLASRTTDTDFRFTVTYTDLKKQNADRWYLSVSDIGLAKAKQLNPTGIIPTGSPVGNVVELRVNPTGVASTRVYKITKESGTVPWTCAGTRATPNYDKSKITFVIPTACFRPTSGFASVLAGSKRYSGATWDGKTPPPLEGTGSDSAQGYWIYQGLPGLPT